LGGRGTVGSLLPPVDTALRKNTSSTQRVLTAGESPCNSVVKGADTAGRRHDALATIREPCPLESTCVAPPPTPSSSHPHHQRCSSDREYDDAPPRVDGIHSRLLAPRRSIRRCCRFSSSSSSSQYPGLSALPGSKFQPGRIVDQRISRRLGSSLISMTRHIG